jgi:hypothetical protein
MSFFGLRNHSVGKNGFALLAVTANVYEPAPACCSLSDTKLPIIEHAPKV